MSTDVGSAMVAREVADGAMHMCPMWSRSAGK